MQKTDIKYVQSVKMLYNIIVMSGDVNFTSEWHNRGKLVRGW